MWQMFVVHVHGTFIVCVLYSPICKLTAVKQIQCMNLTCHYIQCCYNNVDTCTCIFEIVLNQEGIAKDTWAT